MPDEDTTACKRELVRVSGDSSVHSEVMPGVMASYSADINTTLVCAVEAQIHEMLPGMPVTTSLAAGATDRPTYCHAGIPVYGLEPSLVENKGRGARGA